VDTGPVSAAGATIGPLVASRLRLERKAAVAAAFEHHAVGLGLDAEPQLGQCQLKPVVHLAIDNELLGVRIQSRLWDSPVATDEELGDRRSLVIKQVLGRLSNPRPLAKNHQTFVGSVANFG
jgi:hypothetical protein